VPKIIDVPTNVGFISSDFSLTNTMGVTVSPFSGKTRTQDYEANYWTGRVTLAPMRRSQAVEWQSFLSALEGQKNYFKMVDPDGKNPQGTYNSSELLADVRVNSGSNVESVALSFSTSTITAGTAIFDGLVVGDYFTVSGANNEENNDTFKIVTRTSDTVVVIDKLLTLEANTASCKVRQNVKGSKAVSLRASGNSIAGTVKAGDYLAVYAAASTSGKDDYIKQLVMVTGDAVITSGTRDLYSIPIQPKLRQSLTDDHVLGFSSSVNKGLFRLDSNNADWSANQNSIYNIVFSFIEVM
jgi:hypothetical protein